MEGLLKYRLLLFVSATLLAAGLLACQGGPFAAPPQGPDDLSPIPSETANPSPAEIEVQARLVFPPTVGTHLREGGRSR